MGWEAFDFYSDWEERIWRVLNKGIKWSVSKYVFASCDGKFLIFLIFFVIKKHSPVAVTSCLVVNFYLSFPGNVTLVW